MSRERRRQLGYEVERLARAGRSQRQIARALGIARRTVRGLLADLARRRAGGDSALEREIGPQRAPKASKLDGYEEKIRAWIEKYPKLTAVRCHEKLGAEGFKGGYTIVRERLKQLRREVRPPEPSATPIETAPGQRGEFDWSPYVLASGVKVQLFHAALRWSRAPVLAAARDTRQTTTLRLLAGGMEQLGGVPVEWLTDSMPGVVDGWECEQPILNGRYVDFAAYYRFTALIAGRGKPKHKAVAERRFRYHEGNLLGGRTIHSYEEYVDLLAWWTREKVLARKHPETDRPIAEMLELERGHLQPLPARPYDTRDVVVRLVDDYGRVQFDTNHYPVSAAVGSLVYVCADVARIEICDPKARRLIEHERLPPGARIKLLPLHARRARYDLDELVERVAQWGEAAESFAAGVRRGRRYAGPELVRLLQLHIHWSADDIVAALEHALQYGCFEVGKVLRILEARFSPRRFEDLVAESTRRRIREVMQTHPVTQRPLRSYETLSRGDALFDATTIDGGEHEREEHPERDGEEQIDGETPTGPGR